MLLAGDGLADAASTGLRSVRAAGGLGGAICVSRSGEIAMPFTDGHMSRAWRAGDDPVQSAL